MKKLALLLVDSGIAVKKLILEKGRFIIGRSDDADFVISSKDVSRHHVAVEYDGRRCLVEDLKSTNGTFINGTRITKQVLNVGDELLVGDFTIVLDDGSGKFSFPEGTEVGRKGGETAILEDRFTSIRKKIKDRDLEEEFRKIERVVKKSRKRLSSLAHEDKLTGLYNRQYFDKVSRKEFNESKKQGLPLSILFIDIDHFKGVNDTYGHTVGDDALRTISQLVKYSCRKSDIVARYGGEEIVVVLPSTISPDAVQVGVDINRIIGEQSEKLLNIKITVSVGVATYPDCGNTLQKVVECADKALYQAKRAGRNRVVNYDETRP